MTKKNIFVYKLFLSLNISNFSLFFVSKLQPLPEKGHPFFPSNPPLKTQLMTFLMMYADDITVQASELWQQLELASELESELQDTVDKAKKWLVNFNAGKTQLVSFDQSNNTAMLLM